MSCQECDELLIGILNTTMSIDVKKGLVNLLFMDASEIETQLSNIFLLHNMFTFFDLT